MSTHLKIPLKHPHFNPSVCSAWDKGYRYGFNGKEIDKGSEGMGGGGSTYDYGFRINNPSLGKFLSVDPLTASYPWYTPYQFAGNMPIWAVDLDGLEQLIIHENTTRSTFIVPVLITINLTYTIVNSGPGSVSGIDEEAFRAKFKQGNQRIFLSELPGENNELKLLNSEKDEQLAQRALDGDVKAAKKLKRRYNNIFVVDVNFNIIIDQNPNTTLEAATTWANENRAGRGIIMEQIPDDKMLPAYGDNLKSFMQRANVDISKGANATGNADGIDNFIVFSNNIKNTQTSSTDIAVHESGHNITGRGHTKNKSGNYEYHQEGLSNDGYKAGTIGDRPFNNGADLYPTYENLLQILNDSTNRKNISSNYAESTVLPEQ